MATKYVHNKLRDTYTTNYEIRTQQTEQSSETVLQSSTSIVMYSTRIREANIRWRNIYDPSSATITAVVWIVRCKATIASIYGEFSVYNDL